MSFDEGVTAETAFEAGVSVWPAWLIEEAEKSVMEYRFVAMLAAVPPDEREAVLSTMRAIAGAGRGSA
jgi:hypothetical protein